MERQSPSRTQRATSVASITERKWSSRREAIMVARRHFIRGCVMLEMQQVSIVRQYKRCQQQWSNGVKKNDASPVVEEEKQKLPPRPFV